MKKRQRTQRTDGGMTYNRILEAAGDLFASTGFAETTSKMIAARAEVDLASINYHFKSRDGLYHAVLIEAHRRLVSVESLQRLVSTDLPASEKLKKLIEGLVDSTIIDQGWHARVLSRELLSPSSHLQSLQEIVFPQKLPFALSILGEITAIPPGDPALLRCMVSIMAPCAMLLVIGPNVALFSDEIHHRSREALVEHLYRFAMGGLEAIARHQGHKTAQDVSTSRDGLPVREP